MANDHETDVAIIGAGLCGLSVAIALALKGIKAEVYEKLESFDDEKGSSIALAPNALRALDQLGVYTSIRTKGFNFAYITFYNERGSRIARFRNGGKEEYGYKALQIQRSVLHKALRDQCRKNNVIVRYGKQLIATEGDGTVRFSDGSCALSRLVIGADGLHSKMREILSSNADLAYPLVTYTGLCAVVGQTETEKIKTSNEGLFFPCMFLTRHGNISLYPTDFNGKQMQCFAIGALPPRSREEWSTYAKEDAVTFLNTNFKHLSKDQCDLFDNKSDVVIWPHYALEEVSKWRYDNVLLVGDAAHAMLPHGGQGAAQAFEDSITLSQMLDPKLLTDTPALRAILDRYESVRRTRIEVVDKFTASSTVLYKPASWFSQTLKELLLPVVLKFGPDKASALYNYDAKSSIR